MTDSLSVDMTYLQDSQLSCVSCALYFKLWRYDDVGVI